MASGTIEVPWTLKNFVIFIISSRLVWGFPTVQLLKHLLLHLRNLLLSELLAGLLAGLLTGLLTRLLTAVEEEVYIILGGLRD